MDRLTKQKTPQETLEELFGSYTKNIIDKSYHKLKTSENVSKYRPLIIERLNEMVIDDNVINEASEFFVKELELSSLEDGKELVKDKINSVIKAANENSKRNLIGYVRYKTGKEYKEYERKDNISSYVALEFYEELKNNYFIIGAVIDSSSITSDPKVLWYRIEKKRLEDIEYINKVNDPLDISSFKTYIKELTARTFNRNGEAKNDFKNRLGRLNDKFFELLPKSLAFKPLSNVKDFVYSYILEERELSIDTLRENIRTYKSFEELLNQTKIQIDKLKEIKSIYEQYEGAEKNIKLHEYLALKAKDEITEEEIKRIKSYIIKYDEKIKDLDREINLVENKLISYTEKINEYNLELQGNKEFKLINELSRSLRELEKKKLGNKSRYDDFNYLLKSQSKSLKKLYEVSKNKIEIQKLYSILQEINENNLDEFKNINLELEEKIKNEEDALRNENASKKHKINELEEEQKKLEEVIKNLENRKLNYPYGVEELRHEIKSEMKRLGKDVTPKILCELIDVVNPEWKNAVEGYLNTQRFYLLVDEEYFDDALRIYERKSKAKNIYSTGLVNLAGLEKYSECDENSLAQVVTSKSEGAKRYINMILGRVIRCNKVDELKKYRISITKTCMTYQGNVAKKINPKIYEKPYIGEEAYKKQLEIAKEKLEKIKSELNTLRSEVRENNNILSLISSLKLEKLREDSYIIKDFVLINLEIEKLKKEIKDLEKNDSFMAIQLKIEELNKQKEEIYNKKNKLFKEQRDLLVKKDSQEVILKNKEKEKIINTKSIQEKINEFGSIAIEGKARYENERKEKSAETILANFSISKEKNLTIKRNLEIKLNESQREYNNEYDLGAEVSINGMETFLAELDKLEKSKIVEMDDARIVSTMKFFNKLDLQLIIAAPPQKIEPIAPYVNTTLIVMKVGDSGMVEDYENEKL